MGLAFAAGANAGSAAIVAGNSDVVVLNAIIRAEVASISSSVPPNVLEGCDPDFGPKPLNCRCVEIIGDKSVVVQWRCEFWVLGNSNICLSNRWTVSHSISKSGMTTRTQHGRAVIRADAITQGLVNNADDFRAALILPQENNFRRNSVNVVVSADGGEIMYTVTDKETSLALGTGSPAFKIEGYSTSGYDTKIKDFKQLFKEGATLVTNALKLDAAAIISQVADAAVPTAKGRALCRVIGGRTTSRTVLAQMALNVCMDRALNPATLVGFVTNPHASGLLTSVYITQDICPDGEGQIVECRIEWFPNLLNPSTLVKAYDATAFQNLSNDYNSAAMQGKNLMNSVDGPGPPLPNYGGTRGSYVGACLVQTIAPTNNPPTATPTTNFPAPNTPIL